MNLLRRMHLLHHADVCCFGTQRQYERLIEMLILKALDANDERAQRAFRLQVKGRLAVFNFVSTLFARSLTCNHLF